MKTSEFLIVILFSIAVAACGSGGGGGEIDDASDTTAPTVSFSSPANNAIGVAINTVITATFSEMMNASTITQATFTLDNGVTGAVTYTGTTAAFTPTSNLAYGTTYTATITTGAKNAAGDAMAANHTWTFTTAPPPGSIDTSFDIDGKLTTAFGAGYEAATAIGIQSDGKIVTAGGLNNGTNFVFALARYNSNGSLDTSFDTDGKLTTAIGTSGGFAYAIAIQSDGKIVAAGGANSVFALARYNTDGSLDTSFDVDGKLITAFGTSDSNVAAIAIQSDGKIVAAGYISGFTSNGTDYDFALARYNTDGSLDTSFDTDGKLTTVFGTSDDFAVAIVIQSDGKIVAAGSSYNTNDANQYNDFALARYNTDGSLDTSFDNDGKLTTAVGTGYDEAYAIAIQSDGKIVAAGRSFNGTDHDFALARYNTNGSLDTSFDTDGKLTTEFGSYDVARAIAIQSNGKIVTAGESSNGTYSAFALARYNTDGSLDTSFDTDGKLTTAFGTGQDAAVAIAIQSDSKIVAAGNSSNSANNDFALVRYWP